MQLKPLLDYVGKIVDLTREEEAVFISKITTRKYLKGQFLLQQGDVCKHKSFVLSGCLKSFYMDDAGEEHIVKFAVENWWTADLGSFITQSPSFYTIQCLEPTHLAQLSYEALEQLYIEVPKMERLFRIIIQNAFVASEKRIVTNFSLPAKDRYLKFREQYPSIDQRVPQYMIASYLGITKEFLSKVRSQIISGG